MSSTSAHSHHRAAAAKKETIEDIRDRTPYRPAAPSSRIKKT